MRRFPQNYTIVVFYRGGSNRQRRHNAGDRACHKSGQMDTDVPGNSAQ